MNLIKNLFSFLYINDHSDWKYYRKVSLKEAKVRGMSVRKGYFEEVWAFYSHYGFKEHNGMDGPYWESADQKSFIDIFSIFLNDRYVILDFSDWTKIRDKLGMY
jgi:hypothetical protein